MMMNSIDWKNKTAILLVLIFSGSFCAGVKFDVQTLWSRELDGSVDFIQMLDKEIFVATGGNTISLLTTTGRVKWSKTFESKIMAIALSRDFLGVALSNGELILMDHSGNRNWSRKTESYVGFNDAIELTKKGFYAGDMSGSVYLFDFNGELKWKANTDAYVMSLKEIQDTLLVVSDKGVYTIRDGNLTSRLLLEGYVRASELSKDFSAIASGEGDILVFDSMGELLWNETLKETVGVLYPSLDGISAGTKEEKIYVFDLNGRKRWSSKVDGGVTRVFLNKDYVIGSSTEGRVYSFNWRGRLLWVNDEQSPVTSLEANDHALVYGTENGTLKYFVLTARTKEQFYIMASLICITLVIAFWLVVKHWRIRGGH